MKKWRGLRYGNFHVDGVNYGKYLCVASYFSSAGNICLLESDWLVYLSGVNFLRTRIV